MDQLRPLRWKEGMFLRPHHLQQHELNVEAREAARLEAVESHAWGILTLEIEEAALKNYSFVVRSMRAMLPDGTLVDVPGNARLPARTFDAFMKETGRTLDVFFGARIREERRPQVAAEGEGRTRYSVREVDVYDSDVGGEPASLEFLEYDLRLFFGDEPQQGYDTLAAARLVRTGDAARPVIFSYDFAPPCAWLGASSVLREATRSVEAVTANALKEKAAMAKGGGKAEELLQFQALSAALPVLRHIVQDERIHPRIAYMEMARLAGSLMFLETSGASAENLPAYDHRSPAPAFLFLRDVIARLAASAIERRSDKVPMRREGDYFHASLPADFKRPGTRYFIDAGAEESTPRLRVLMMAAKISAPGRMATLREFALQGVPTEPLPAPPDGLDPGQTGTFFRLKSEHEEWGNYVVPGAELTAFLLGAPADIRLSVVLVFPKS